MAENSIGSSNLYDAVIVGGGPAGLTAAIYLARARYRVLVLEKDHFGGQITITDNVVNYPGVLSASGEELAQTMRKQAEGFGAEFKIAEVTSLDMSRELKVVHTSKGDIDCLSVLLATGASPRNVGFEGEDEFKGHGVSYCATCDGEFFADKDVFVIGGGFAAAEESVFLTRYAKHVFVVVRKDHFSCAAETADKALKNSKITVLFNTKIAKIEGDNFPRSMVLEETDTGDRYEYEPEEEDGTFGVFVFAGYEPVTQLIEGMAELDSNGYVVVDDHQMTTVDGLFAAGDVCPKPLRQVATAVGQAATTATEMERYIKDAQERVGRKGETKTARVHSGDSEISLSGLGTGMNATGEVFTGEDKASLANLFERMEKKLVLRVAYDDRPVSKELEEFVTQLDALTDKIMVVEDSPDPDAELPYVTICNSEGVPFGMTFHGAPLGHEMASFAMGLYNAAGPGQPVDEADRAKVDSINDPLNFKVVVTLTCNNCPDVVMATQHMAALNPNITADIYDAGKFPDIAREYSIMAVPFLIVNDGEITSIGRKGMSEILQLLD